MNKFEKNKSILSPADTLTASHELIERLRKYLCKRGYSRRTIEIYIRKAEHFYLWLENQEKRSCSSKGYDVESLLSGYLSSYCYTQSPTYEVRYTRAALHHLSIVIRNDKDDPKYLGTNELISKELAEYANYQSNICGLSPSTQIYRNRYAWEFLTAMFGDGPIIIPKIRPQMVMKWVAHRSRSCKSGTAGVITSSIRRYLRFCQFRGLTDELLVYAVPRIPNWKLSGIPRHLNEEELERFLNSFDRSSASGCRDYIMAICMAEMGLRVSEVARLELQDVDLRQSVLHIHKSKGGYERILPFTPRFGRAITGYFRHSRPRTSSAELFLRHRAPRNISISSEMIRGVMRRAYARAGFPSEWTGTHLLRHTAATRMHQRGATLKEVADVLGHKSINTTIIYTKVNLTALETVPLPWPEVQP
jgi:integrase/recombinase XerD